jgi:hypothetical protein
MDRMQELNLLIAAGAGDRRPVRRRCPSHDAAMAGDAALAQRLGGGVSPHQLRRARYLAATGRSGELEREGLAQIPRGRAL